jgi:hypothetical protein
MSDRPLTPTISKSAGIDKSPLDSMTEITVTEKLSFALVQSKSNVITQL